MRSMLEPGAMAATIETAIDFYSALLRSGIQYFIIAVLPGDIETPQLFKELVLPAVTG